MRSRSRAACSKRQGGLTCSRPATYRPRGPGPVPKAAAPRPHTGGELAPLGCRRKGWAVVSLYCLLRGRPSRWLWPSRLKAVIKDKPTLAMLEGASFAGHPEAKATVAKAVDVFKATPHTRMLGDTPYPYVGRRPVC